MPKHITLPRFDNSEYDEKKLNQLVTKLEQILSKTNRALLEPQIGDSATIQFDPTKDVLEVDYTATGAVVVDLPLCSDMIGRIIYIKDTGFACSANNITITANGIELIDLLNTFILNADGICVQLYSNGVKWHILSSF